MKKGFVQKGLFVGFSIISFILMIGFVESAVCDVRLSGNCNVPSKSVMELWDTTNAHARSWYPPLYNYVLCCNYTGNHTCEFDGSNKIVVLWNDNNSHVEVPSGTLYTKPVCYENLTCYSESGGCSSGGEAILSLFSATNSHVGNANAYDLKICCYRETITGFCGDGTCNNGETCETCPGDCGGACTNCVFNSAEWNVTNALNNQPVILNLQNNANCNNQEVEFLMYESDGVWGMGPIVVDTPPANVVLTGDGNNQGFWVAEYHYQGVLDGDPEYKFIARLVNNPNVNITSSNELKVSNDTYNLDCSNIHVCGDYNDSTSCNNDISLCMVGNKTTIDENNCIKIQKCSWNISSGTCERPETTYCTSIWGGEITIGLCTYLDNYTDDCSDGYLEYNWDATWIWNESNNYTLAQIAGKEGYILRNGGPFYSYDPNNDSLTCGSGDNIIPCPVKIELSFFDWRNIILIILVLGIVYSFCRKKK